VTPPGAETVVVRYGDMSIKSHQVREHMERRLAENLRALLDERGIAGEVELTHTRPLIHATEDEVAAATAAAGEAFGVVSASPAAAIDPEREAITETAAAAARAGYEGGSFAVDARRAGDELPFTSDDVEEFAGAAVFEALAADGSDPVVDLDDPDFTVSIECRPEVAFVYLDSVEGPGGLPLGTQTRQVALLSGGIDSPVAAYEVMRRGSPVVPVYVDLGEYAGADHRARVEEVAEHLSAFAPNFDTRLQVVEAGPVAEDLAATMEGGRMLSLRRFMLRVGEAIAESLDADGVVTGEAIGQKSSQTARNVRVTDAAVDLPVHRPLLTVDKNEVTERAREIGTFRDSTIPAGCQRFAPTRPETNGLESRLREDEPEDLFERAERVARQARIVDT
jgi:thiamine biosynthesis protein ThiI